MTKQSETSDQKGGDHIINSHFMDPHRITQTMRIWKQSILYIKVTKIFA